MPQFSLKVIGLIFIAIVAGLSPALSIAADKIEYNRDIRPILSDACFACHGPDSAARKAELRLDQRQAALDMGAITPGKPDESELIRRILSDDANEVMPPPKTKKKLTAAQKQLLTQWVKDGAEYQLHWSFIAPQRVIPPEVKNKTWPRNPIDNFVLARLEAIGLEPAPEADRRTLARRVSLDLTGLPPKPELVADFVNDKSPDAYEKLVDKLLASPQWGEHRGRYWLDYSRYADTHGIHFDNFREMWTYRDWVIGAFNRNIPFDQFTIETLAGDLIPNRTEDQLIGSGFNRCNMTTNEGGIIDEEYLVLYTRDRTETTSQVWLGLTAGCAVCHDHKFDPLSQREFYEMAAFFNNTTQAAKDGNIKDTPPIIVVPIAADRTRWDELKNVIAHAKQQVEDRRRDARPEFDSWLATAKEDVFASTIPTQGLHFAAALDQSEGKATTVKINDESREVTLAEAASWQPGPTKDSHSLKIQGKAVELSDVGDFEKDQPFTLSAWVQLHANDSSGALCSRMDNANNYRGWDFWTQQRRVGVHIIDKWPETGLKVIGRGQIRANQWTHVAVTYDGSGNAAGVKIYYNGDVQIPNVESDKLGGGTSIRTDVPFNIGQRHTSDPASGAMIQDLRIYRQALNAAQVQSLARLTKFAAILAKEPDKRTDAEKNDLYAWWLGALDDKFQSLSAAVAPLEKEENAIKARGTIAHVMNEKSQMPEAFTLFRGEYDKRRDQVAADTPNVLPPFPADYPKNRLGFARWLLLPEQPLTARVTVNRFWQEVFGTGIVRTTGDLGVSGELPSHPELLDWLALEFSGQLKNGEPGGVSPRSPWDVKQFFKLLVTSATYRQAATTTPVKLDKDPQNRLLSRGPRFRMDAEMIRDYSLAASGLLVPKIGGPSVKPYQPEGVWEAIAMNVSNTRSYQRDTGENLYRRSLYTFWKRMAPPASMDIFNAPNRELCVVRRERTNTPLQALATLNDEQHIEAARHLAETVLKARHETASETVQSIGLRLVSREFRADELSVIQNSLDELLAYYKAHLEEAQKVITVGESKPGTAIEAPTLAAWTMLANELMNLDEVLNK